MSITYCCLISRSEKLLLAESSSKENYDKKVFKLFQTIMKENVNDIIEVDDNFILTYIRTKKIVFICLSHKYMGEDRPRRFIEHFVNLVINEYKSIDNVIPHNPNEQIKLCLQKTLGEKLVTLLDSYDSSMYKNKQKINHLTNDMNEIKVNMNHQIKKMVHNNESLESLLATSQHLKKDANEYKQNAKELEKETRCFKPWMGYALIVIAIMLIVYAVFSLYHCGNLSIVCSN